MKKRARIVSPSDASIAEAAQVLKAAQLVAMPTETVYGLAACALDPDAVAKIFTAKDRPKFDPLIVHVAPEKPTLAHLMKEQILDLRDFSDLAIKRVDQLIRAFWPGPLTLVLPRSLSVPELVTGGLPTVGVRMPKHPVAQALIRKFGLPLAAPSANRFGRISPTTAKAVEEELGDRIEWILDGGPCEIGLESTVLEVNPEGEMRLLRPGAVTEEELFRITGARPSRVKTGEILGPGMTASHYAPTKKLILLSGPVRDLMSPPNFGGELPKKLGLLIRQGPAETARAAFRELTGREVIVRVLAEDGSPVQAGKHLFQALRELDQSEAELLFAEPWRDPEGMGFAIGDRLQRAAQG